MSATIPTLITPSGEAVRAVPMLAVGLDGNSALAQGGVAYSDRSVPALTANQAAGVDPIIGSNAARKALQFGAPVDFKVSLSPSASDGLRVYGSARDSFIGAECPLGALYLVAGSGLITGGSLIVWEA